MSQWGANPTKANNKQPPPNSKNIKPAPGQSSKVPNKSFQNPRKPFVNNGQPAAKTLGPGGANKPGVSPIHSRSTTPMRDPKTGKVLLRS